MKLATVFHLVPNLRFYRYYLIFAIHLRGMMLDLAEGHLCCTNC